MGRDRRLAWCVSILGVAAGSLSAQTIALPTAGPGDSALSTLSHPPNAQAQFLAKNPGWQAASTNATGLFFQDPAGPRRAAVFGHLMHQDAASGAWVAYAALAKHKAQIAGAIDLLLHLGR